MNINVFFLPRMSGWKVLSLHRHFLFDCILSEEDFCNCFPNSQTSLSRKTIIQEFPWSTDLTHTHTHMCTHTATNIHKFKEMLDVLRYGNRTLGALLKPCIIQLGKIHTHKKTACIDNTDITRFTVQQMNVEFYLLSQTTEHKTILILMMQ